MGFVIFESSGTFTPGNYGLTYGDVITVVAVGGWQLNSRRRCK